MKETATKLCIYIHSHPNIFGGTTHLLLRNYPLPKNKSTHVTWHTFDATDRMQQTAVFCVPCRIIQKQPLSHTWNVERTVLWLENRKQWKSLYIALSLPLSRFVCVCLSVCTMDTRNPCGPHAYYYPSETVGTFMIHQASLASFNTKHPHNVRFACV